MKKAYISVASHHSEDLIMKNFAHYPKSVKNFQVEVSIIDNIGSKELEEFCLAYGFNYYHDGKQRGFGENHNYNFKLLSPKDDDLFLVSDPDIFLEVEELEGMLNDMDNSEADIMNIRSYLDIESGKLDYPDRYFPGILNFFISLATGKRLHYGTNEKVKNPEWMSGGFMLFKALSYKKLGGFDEDYFMYCEDIDICFRAKKMGMILEYNSKRYNIHDSRMDSRKLFSKNMFYHVKTAFMFVFKNRFFKPVTVAKSVVV
jgi:GT2 family glycosyltransferase